LKARGNVDAIAHQVAVGFFDDVADVNPDPKFDPSILSHARIALDQAALDLDRATNRIDDAPELDNAPVTGALDDAAVVGRDGGVDQIAPEAPEPRERAILVHAGESAVANNVGNQNCR
jgi:hypothetical protein